MNSSGYYLMSLLSQVPMLLVLVLGIAWALVRRRQHPTPSMLVLGGCLLLFLLTVTYPLVTALTLSNGVDGRASATTILGIVGVVFGVFRAGAYGMLVAAAFVHRAPESAKVPAAPAWQQPG